MKQNASRKCERRVGKLEKFNTKPGIPQAQVRVGESVFYLPSMSRGVLQSDDSIKHCINGDRFDPIAKDSLIAIDLVYDDDGKNPSPGLWAPKTKLASA